MGITSALRLSLVIATIALMFHVAEAVQIRKGQGPVGSLTGTNQTSRAKSSMGSAADLLKNMQDNEVFVQIGDDDKVTWGMLHSYIDASLNLRISSLFSAAPNDEMSGVRFGLYQQALTKTLKRYLGAGVIAYEAKKSGITVSAADFDAKIVELKKQSPQPSPFQYQFLTNVVYQQAYVEKYIKPSIEIPEAAITNLIVRRHAENLSIPATNALLRSKIEDIRAKIVKGEISFAEAAEESDCSDCSSNGGDCGTWEEDIENIATNLLKVCFSLPINVLSEVVETPEAFHLVKITGKYEPTQKARDEDGEVSSVDVHHIQIDKWVPEPEFTRETAREFIEQRQLSRVLASRQYELLDNTPIKSVIPLKAKDDDKRAEKIRKIMDSVRRNEGR